MANARSKVVFETRGEENLRPLATDLFMGVLNPDEIKHQLYSTKVMDYVEETRTVRGRSESGMTVDRCTEVQDTLVNRIGCYLDYYQSGGFAVRNGAAATDLKSFSFRVLVVLKSAERRNNTAERLLQRTPPILTMAWLTTLAEVTGDPLGKIWIRPAEDRETTTGTRFDPDQTPPTKTYHRQPEREAFIESRIKRRGLFER